MKLAVIILSMLILATSFAPAHKNSRIPLGELFYGDVTIVNNKGTGTACLTGDDGDMLCIAFQVIK